MKNGRALLIVGGLGVAAVLGLPRLAPQPPIAFEPVAGADGFRIAGGGVSGALDPLAGVGGPAAARPDRAALCDALAASGVDSGPPDAPRVTVLTDHRCPNCRALDPELTALAAAGEIRLAHLYWPVFGPSSEVAARAALAAEAQGQGQALHERLMGSSFAPTPAYLADLARSLDLDVDRLAVDAAGPAVDRAMAQGRAIAAELGLAGVPATIVGRSVAQGALSLGQIRALLAAEAAETTPPPCAAAP